MISPRIDLTEGSKFGSNLIEHVRHSISRSVHFVLKTKTITIGLRNSKFPWKKKELNSRRTIEENLKHYNKRRLCPTGTKNEILSTMTLPDSDTCDMCGKHYCKSFNMDEASRRCDLCPRCFREFERSMDIELDRSHIVYPWYIR